MSLQIDSSAAAFAALVLFGAYIVRGIAGFGSALIAIPLLTQVLPLTVVVPLVVLLDGLGSVSQGLKNRAHVEWPELLPLLPFTIIGVLIALFLLKSLDPVLLSRILGGGVLCYGAYQLLPLPTLRVTRLSALPYGTLGGLIGTMFGTGGPFYIMYLGMRGLDKVTMRASFATWFIIDSSMRLTGYATFGILDADTLLKAGMSLPFAALGLYIGGRIHTNISQDTFRRVISTLLLFSGGALMLKY
ncbi:MAG: putative membrane protein YfcA [Gammaproteobacteria bacterium]|jgi:uncharacterized membrane protein YfcA